jgi:capsule polysaccharide export protein KpsE/RkpR
LRWSLALLVLLATALGSTYFARAHAVLSSPQEVGRLADLLRSHRGALRSVHAMPRECDPSKQAAARYSLLGKLEEALAQAKTKLADLRWSMGEDDPSGLMPNSEIASLQRRVAEERAKPGKDEATARRGRETLGGLVANDEERMVGREFAEKAYVSAPASLERARLKADRQQPYVVASINVFAMPLLLWAPGVVIADGIGD